MAATHAQTSARNGSTESGFDASAYTEAYKVWGDFYQRFAEESLDLFQRNMENAQKIFPAAVAPDLQGHWGEHFAEMNRQWEEQGFTMTPDGYQKMYSLWLDTWSKSFDSYMRTPEFVEQSGKGLEAFSDVKAKLGEMMEEYWHTMHLPSTRDMRELYHKLYLAERKMDEHERKLDEILDLLKGLNKMATGGSAPATATVSSPAAPVPAPKTMTEKVEASAAPKVEPSPEPKPAPKMAAKPAPAVAPKKSVVAPVTPKVITKTVARPTGKPAAKATTKAKPTPKGKGKK